MKLKKYDASKTGSRKGKPTISFSDKGVIRLSKQAALDLGFTLKDKIAFLQDEENPTDWYITKDKEGFDLRAVNNSDALILNSSQTRNDFYTSLFESDDEREWPTQFMLATNPVKHNGQLMYAILIPNQ